MRKAVLLRLESGDEGTFGMLVSDTFSIYVTELPWRNNERSKSCIPEGVYKVSWHKSPRFGWTYKLQEVPDRSEVLLHSGNFAGDIALGYISNSHGCLLPALKLGYINGQKAGLMSSSAVLRLNKFFNKEPFELEITNAYISSIPS